MLIPALKIIIFIMALLAVIGSYFIGRHDGEARVFREMINAFTPEEIQKFLNSLDVDDE